MAEFNGVELTDLVLHSGRLTLRPWQPPDAVTVAAIMSDERIGRYLPLPSPYTEHDALDFVTQHGVVGRVAGTRLDCAVAENTSSTVVGSASLTFDGRSRASIGYWFGTDHWGRGYATEAVQTLARFGFANGLTRIRIVCEFGNTASARVALRAGFAYEGIQRGELAGRGAPLDGPVFGRVAGDPGTPLTPGLPALDTLTDGVVTVRPMVAEDWPTVLVEGSNPESLAWGLGYPALTETSARRRCAVAGIEWLTGGQGHFTICEAGSGTGAGTLSLRPGPPGVRSVGYGIVPDFRGRGFTTRALRLVSAWAFEAAGLNRLELGCKVGNVASARSAEAAGFLRESLFVGRLRNADGTYSDEIGYGLTR